MGGGTPRERYGSAMSDGTTGRDRGWGALRGGAWLAAVASLAVVGPAPGQTLGELIDQLDASSHAERERASRLLGQRRDLELAEIERMLRGEELSPEQRLRLDRIAWDRFRTGPRAGMGIQFGGTSIRGVQIGGTVEGFDADRVLRANDVLLEMDGRPIGGQNDLRLEILSREPDEVVELRIEREGTEREVRVRMGSYSDLNAGRGGMQDELLRQAWLLRRDRRAASRGGAWIEGSLGPAWASGEEAMHRRELDAGGFEEALGGWERWVLDGRAMPVVGGEANGGADRFGMPRVRIAGRDASLPALGIREVWMLEYTAQTRLQLLSNWLQERRGLIDQRLASIARERSRGGLDAAERRALERERERLARLREAIDVQRERWASAWDEVPVDR